jgi:hypothetical protein
MKSKLFMGVVILLISISALSCSPGGTFSIYLRYKPLKDFPSLQERVGSTLGIPSLKDERSYTLYIGQHTRILGGSNYFISYPFPLEKAIIESLAETLSRYGVKTVSIPNWDMKPESLKNIEADSVLMVEIKKFWTEGKSSLFGTKVKTSIQLLIHLGVKKEGKVFTRNVEVEKEMTVARLTPEKVEHMINETLTEIFDSFFSDPFKLTSTTQRRQL